MNSSGITRGVASGAIAALAVAGLPLLSSPAHAAPTSVRIDNLRDRTTFDLDELRDNDDFRLQVLDETGAPIEGTTPEYQWVLDTAAGTVTGNWLPAESRAERPKVFWVEGPTKPSDLDGITDAQLAAGTWTLRAQASGTPAAEESMEVAESEITLDAPVTKPDGSKTVSGRLANGDVPLVGRAVAFTYAPQGSGDAGLVDASGVTGPNGRFTVTLVDPQGATGQRGALTATASGEQAGDNTQLLHKYGPNDESNPAADATDTRSVTWPDPISAELRGRSNGARADVLKVVAPDRAEGAQVRLFRVAGGRLTLLQSSQLNSSGDKQFRVNDRNRRQFTTYVAKVGATATSARDDTNSRRVR